MFGDIFMLRYRTEALDVRVIKSVKFRNGTKTNTKKEQTLYF